MNRFNLNNNRTEKGKSLIDFPDSFIVVDIETTGLDPQWNKIIEISAIKVFENNIVDSFSTLINPQLEIDEFISSLTGITNDMVKEAPTIEIILPTFREFIGNSILIGHNVNFDINFLYDSFISAGLPCLSNSFVDTMRLGRWLIRDIENHRLQTLATALKVNINGLHRALNDCYTTLGVFNQLKIVAIEKFETIENFVNYCKKKSTPIRAKDVIGNEDMFNPDNLLFKKNIAITGALERFSRKEAMQIIADIGGICNDNVTSNTNFLILGNNDYNAILKGEKSSKLLKAEKLKAEGKDIEILSENVFYDLINSFLNLHNDDVSKHYNTANNMMKRTSYGCVKDIDISEYWDDIYKANKSLYFTNWHSLNVIEEARYDNVEIEDLIYSSSMDRSNSDIQRIKNQYLFIKQNIEEKLNGKLYGKGAKSAKCYIEFYYTDYADYLKYKEMGLKVFHAINVEEFFYNNQEQINKYFLELKEKELNILKEKEELKKQKKLEKLEKRAIKKDTGKEKHISKLIVQLNDDGLIINKFTTQAEASRVVGVSTKSIRDCINGVQKHAGGYVWKIEEL